jgi:hypothetical protein
VALVDIGIVRMAVTQGLVGVPVGVRLAGRREDVVVVLVVRVVLVPVLALHPLFWSREAGALLERRARR